METSTTSVQSSPKIRLSSVSFLVAVLLFLLPFVNIKCNGQNFASNNGIGLAFGTNYKTEARSKTFSDDSDKTVSITEKQSGKIYVSALLALLLGVAGFILSILNPNKLVSVIGVLAAIAMIVLMIQINYDIRDKSAHDITGGIGENLKVTAEFTTWYYLSLLGFIAAAFFSYWRKPIVISG